MKKLIFIILIIALMIVPFNNLALGENENEPTYIAINDDLVYFKDIYPEMKDETVFVPMRIFVQSMGANVQWDNKNKVATINKDNEKIIVDVNKGLIHIDDEKTIYSQIFIKENRIMIPFEIIADHFGYQISYIKNANILRVKDDSYLLSNEELINKIDLQLDKEKERIELEEEKKNKAQEYIKLDQPLKVAYITFDDGPSKYTNEILNILKENEAKGTFFMLSNNIKRYSKEVKSIIENGNSVGLHGVTHDVKKVYKSPSSLVEEMNEDNNSLFDASGVKTNLIRTPYGSKPYMTEKFRDAYVKEGYKMWDWNIDSKDSLQKSILPSTIVKNIKDQLQTRQVPIILLHEKKSTVEALPEILYYLKQEGYVMSPIKCDQYPVNFWNDTR